MRRPSPLKHKEAANEALHTTLSAGEHEKLHGENNVFESEDKNIQDQKNKDEQQSRTTGTDLNILYNDWENNPSIISKEDLHKGDFWDDAEDRMVINLRNNKYIKDLNIKVQGPDDDSTRTDGVKLERLGRHDLVQLTNEFGRTVYINKSDEDYLDKIDLFAKRTRADRLKKATQEHEKNGGIVEKTVPVIRNGKPINWKDVIKPGAETLYNSLTEGEKRRLASQDEITKFETQLLNLKNNDKRLKDESEKNSIIKPPIPEDLVNRAVNTQTGLVEENKD